MKNLGEKIKNLQLEIQFRIDHINEGGCIHFAYFLSKKLKELKISHKIIYLNSSPLEKPRSCAHVVVYIPNIGYVDGRKTIKTKAELTSSRSYKCYHDFSEYEHNHVRLTGNWNWSYWKRQNKLLSYLIKKHIV